jgi:transcriptional regulator with XRE-family HTH domain
MSVGDVLAARRAELGLTIEQAARATRIGAQHLATLETGELEAFAAPVYGNGYLRSYARYLGIDPDPLLAQMPREVNRPLLALGLENPEPRPRAFLSGRAVAAAAVVLLAGGVAGYVWRQMVVAEHQGGPTPAARAPAAAPGATDASPLVQARPIVVGVRVTDSVWINVTIDGQPQYGDTGITLVAGSVVYFTGVDIKITSGKASATIISIEGRVLGPLGSGVATREFSSQTSP